MSRRLTDKQKARLIEIFEVYGDQFCQLLGDPDFYLGDVEDAGKRRDEDAYTCPAERSEREHVRYSYLEFNEIAQWFETVEA